MVAKRPPPRPAAIEGLRSSPAALRLIKSKDPANLPSSRPRREQLSLFGLPGGDPGDEGSDSCYTALYVLEAAETILGGIDTDPAWSPRSLVEAPNVYTSADNGLVQPWIGSVWCNPPYSDVTPWIRRARDHAAAGGRVLMLVKSDHSTEWWGLAESATVVGLIRHRLSFFGPGTKGHKGGAPFCSVLFGWNCDLDVCRIAAPWATWLELPPAKGESADRSIDCAHCGAATREVFGFWCGTCDRTFCDLCQPDPADGCCNECSGEPVRAIRPRPRDVESCRQEGKEQ